MFDDCESSRSFCERCGVGRGAHDSGRGRKGNSGRRSKRVDRYCTSVTYQRGRRSVLCTADFSIPNNLARFCAETRRHVVTKVQLGRIEDEEPGWEREIACVDETGEEVVRLYVDGERLGQKYHLEYTIEDRVDQVEDSDS